MVRANLVEGFQGGEGMFVHRVAVVEVPDHQRIDSLKLREKRDQQTQTMHVAQGLGGVRLHQDPAEVAVLTAAGREQFARGALTPTPRIFSACRLSDKPMARRHFKQAQQQIGVPLQGGGLAGEDAVADHGEVRV